MAKLGTQESTDGPAGGGAVLTDTTPDEGREPGKTGTTLPEGASIEEHDREMFRRLAGTTESAATPEPGPLPGAPAPSTTLNGNQAAPATPTEPGAATQGGDHPLAPATSDGAELREVELITRSALQRDGWPSSVIDNAVKGASLDDLRTLGESAKARQAGYDRLGNRVAALEKGTPAKSTEKPGPTPSSDDDDLADLSNVQRKLIQRYRDMGDDEMAELHLEEYRERAGRRAEGEPKLGAGQGVSTEQAVEQLRAPLDVLQRDYPQIADPKERALVVETAARLVAAGVVEGPADGASEDDLTRFYMASVAKAAAVRYGETDPVAAQHRLHTTYIEQRNGQPNPGTQEGPVTSAPATIQDAERETFRALAAGKDPAAVQAQHNVRVNEMPPT